MMTEWKVRNCNELGRGFGSGAAVGNIWNIGYNIKYNN